MPEFALIKRKDDLLQPAEIDSAEVMRKMPEGAVLRMKYSVARNPGNHRRWFKFVEVSFDMQDTYQDKEIWRKVLAMLGGHFDQVMDKNGNMQFWPRSISYKELDDEFLFARMFKTAVNAFLDRYGNGMTEEEFMRVMDFT